VKTITYGIITVMVTGLIGNALALWKNHAVVDHKVTVLEKKQEKQDNRQEAIEKKIDDLHWFIIKSKGIKVPSGDK